MCGGQFRILMSANFKMIFEVISKQCFPSKNSDFIEETLRFLDVMGFELPSILTFLDCLIMTENKIKLIFI